MILIAYASTHGSTREVAEAIAATLREHNLTTDLQEAKNVPTPGQPHWLYSFNPF
jgi:menaquinone-dependent protoporphyrinogen IX oxidase